MKSKDEKRKSARTQSEQTIARWNDRKHEGHAKQGLSKDSGDQDAFRQYNERKNMAQTFEQFCDRKVKTHQELIVRINKKL